MVMTVTVGSDNAETTETNYTPIFEVLETESEDSEITVPPRQQPSITRVSKTFFSTKLLSLKIEMFCYSTAA
jgi:hypothetical protein